jgi:hypothetical protein
MKRKAANRPLKYSTATKIVSTRVPINKIEAFKKMVKAWLKKFEK